MEVCHSIRARGDSLGLSVEASAKIWGRGRRGKLKLIQGLNGRDARRTTVSELLERLALMAFSLIQYIDSNSSSLKKLENVYEALQTQRLPR